MTNKWQYLPNSVHELGVLAIKVKSSLTTGTHWPHGPVTDLSCCRVTLIVIMRHERQ